MSYARRMVKRLGEVDPMVAAEEEWLEDAAAQREYQEYMKSKDCGDREAVPREEWPEWI